MQRKDDNMSIYQFKTPDVLPQTIINTIFVFEKHSYRILDIIKTWGEAPVLLGYVKMQDEQGNLSQSLIKCKKEFTGTNWHITIEKNKPYSETVEE